MSGIPPARAPLQVCVVDLGVTWEPATIPLVMVQPRLELDRTDAGWRLSQASLNMVDSLLDGVADRATRTDARLVVFPEYSLPSDRAEEIATDFVQRLPRDCVVIAGLDGMPAARFRDLTGFAVTDASARWANCCLVAANGSNASPTYQPKLLPAEGEQALAGMVNGNVFHVFKAGRIAFSVLICYDLIGTLSNGKAVVDWIFETQNDGLLNPLDLLISIQCNENPDHRHFLAAQDRLLCTARVDALLAVNKAGPGQLALYAQKGRIKISPKGPFPDSFCVHPLHHHNISRAVFRATDPSVFTSKYRHCRYNAIGGAQLPFESPMEHTIQRNGTLSPQPRAISPFSWALEQFALESHPHEDGCPLPMPGAQAVLERYYSDLVADLASLPSSRHSAQLTALYSASTALSRDPLLWDATERRVVGQMARSLAAVRFGGDVELSTAPSCASAAIRWERDWFVTVVAGDNGIPCQEAINSLVRRCEDQYVAIPNDTLVVLLTHRGQGFAKPTPIRPLTVAATQIHDNPRLLTIDSATSFPPDANSRVTQANTTAMNCLTLDAIEAVLGVGTGTVGGIRQAMRELFA